jgi:predicted DNA-binding helix-hairpin-helix protein
MTVAMVTLELMPKTAVAMARSKLFPVAVNAKAAQRGQSALGSLDMMS